MPNDEDILEALRCSIDLVSLVYICRLYIKLSTFRSTILPSTARTHLIKQAVNDRYASNHTIEDIMMIIRAVAVTADCKPCSLVYNHSSWYSLIYQWRKINNSSLNSMLKVYYLCDSFGFTYSIFFDYTCQLLHDQYPFQSFSRILIDRFNYEHQNNNIILQLIQLAKLFQCHWLLYQIVRFEFMLGRTQIVNLPVSLNRNELNYHFECYSGWWYHLFTTFWSRHKSIPNIKCSPSDCSRCVIVDGHRKCRRLVCSFKNVVDTSIEEMTAFETGCPYTPCRRTESSNSVDLVYCRYHQPSILLSPSINLQKAGDMAAEFSKWDRDFLSEHKVQCQNYRNDSEEIKKNKTYGILASYHPCGVAVGFTEAIKAEAKKNNKNSSRKDQGPTSSLSPTMISSNNNNNNNNSSSSLPSTSLSYEILLEHNKMLQEDIRRLRDENEYLKNKLMSKPTDDATGFSLEIPRLIINEPNVLVKLFHPKQKETPNYILNNAMGNVFSTARRQEKKQLFCY
ncbi:unnamed protein product [Rotaria sordida]|uniref:Uncharacterized protein n=1 Tax=Rotaria sordida TaxID=392033 RepID=A0A819T0I7_9BILA|nr:unnamed protein product [Rotaria sordida]